MNKETIYMMMLQVLDDPTSVRIIVQTSYPDFNNFIDDTVGNAYFMIDHGNCGTTVEANDSEVYDHWQVTDSIQQTHKFNSNAELIEFLESIEGLITEAWVESF